MKIFVLIFGVLHLLSHVVPSLIMAYHLWHMHKFHGKSKWKILAAIAWTIISILTLIELPDMLSSFGQCN